MFISFKHPHQNQSPTTSNENSRFNTPPNELLTTSPADNNRRNQRSAAPTPKTEEDDLFIHSVKRVRTDEAGKHLDLITKALEEEGGDSISSELVERLEKLLTADQHQPLDLITKALEEEGGESMSHPLFHTRPDDLMIYTRTDSSNGSQDRENDSPFRIHRSSSFNPMAFLTDMLDQTGNQKPAQRKGAKRTASGDIKR